VIAGDVHLRWGWPSPRIALGQVTFANPAWAQEPKMVEAAVLQVTVQLADWLQGRLVLPEVRLERASVFLEQGSAGRRNWWLDARQADAGAAIRIDRLTVVQGTLGYDDTAQKTRIRAEVSTTAAGVSFDARGQFRGQPLKARGTGGPVLALRDTAAPYPLKIDASLGATQVQAEGSITDLVTLTAVDMQLGLRGDNLEHLFPVLGIAVPATPAYATRGRLVHVGTVWRYEGFSGQVGVSDIAGSLELQTGGKRPALRGALTSRLLDIADLGPVIGSRPGRLQAARARAAPAAGAATPPTPLRARVLPDLPFNTDRWGSVDADVTLKAERIQRAREVPLDNLVAHLRLKDEVLTLDPLDFGLAGGSLASVVTLDGSKSPIQAHAVVRARKILLSRLFPTVDLSKNSIGQINGAFDLRGSGNSVGSMLATANGQLGLVVAGGEVSQLMMEQAGLHLWEVLQLNLTGDQRIKLRCAVAEFTVRQGNMHADALVFDTAVTTLNGRGDINLARETLDLRFDQDTKNTSPLALRSPILVRGSFARPDVGVDKTRVAARALGAVVLGVVNPFLALIPLIDAGPGADSDCAALVRQVRVPPPRGPARPPTR
jgi:AsmA protein